MNRKDLETIRINNMKRLDPAYRSNLNRIEYSTSESMEHFMAKTVCFILLRNGVPADIIREHDFSVCISHNSLGDKTLSEHIKWIIQKEGHKFKHDWERTCVVSEARFKPIPNFSYRQKLAKKPIFYINRRADLFVLSSMNPEDCGKCIEIETDSKRAERFKNDPNTIVVMI